MSDFPTRQEPGSLAPVEPLTCKTAGDKLYERSASVVAESSRMLALNPPEWLRKAPGLQNETLVHLMSKSRDRDRELMGELLQVLSTRIHRLARSRLRGIDKDTAQEIVLKVEFEITRLLLERTPLADAEFLEVAFADVVVKRTLDARRAHKRSEYGKRRGEIAPGATDEDGDEIERPIELAADARAGFEGSVINRQDVAKASQAVKDPQLFQVVQLHFGDGLPITEIAERLNISRDRVRYGLRAGMKAIRKAFGVDNEKNESFDDVLTMLMLEEKVPTGEALARWSERYPQYREDLADFFAVWTEQENSTEPEPDTDEDAIVEKSVKYAMSILEAQGRVTPIQPVPPLSESEQLVLTAAYLLGGRGYPVTIAWKVGEMQGKNPLLASVYASLESLERKGLILSREADPVSEPENVGARDYYTVSMAGSRALAYAKQTSTVLARFLPDFA